jgi:hypothetical protein
METAAPDIQESAEQIAREGEDLNVEDVPFWVEPKQGSTTVSKPS